MAALPHQRQRRSSGAHNQALIREVNERIAQLGRRLSTDLAFVCECTDRGCTEQVELSLAQYEAVRADPARFLVLPGHEDPAEEDVVESTDRYRIVRKLGHGRTAAVRLDPRRRRLRGLETLHRDP